MVIEFDRVNNPYWPLPPDYAELTLEGQRKARVNACRLWTLPGTPEQLAERRVASLDFFDRYYLWPSVETDFDPGFYDTPPKITPDMHWAIVRLWATARMSITIAPRGSAKSSLTRKDMLLCSVSVPRYSQVYATSTHDNTKFTANLLRTQFYTNPRIIEDWAKEYKENSLRPAKNASPSGIEHFYLTNGSHIRSLSMETRVRGVRPRRFRLDDPEFDTKASTDSSVVRENMHNFLFGIVGPTVTHDDAGVDWLATFVSPRHYAFHAMQTHMTPQGLRAVDPRFDFWARFFIPAAYEEDGILKSCWPDMWPVTKAERLAQGRLSQLSLEEIKAMFGTAIFNREYLGKLSANEGEFLPLDPSPTGRHAYWYENVDPILATDPRASEATICWEDAKGEVIRTPMRKFMANARLFMTVDTAFTETSHSDRRVCHLMAITKDNLLFSMDLWSDQKGDSVLLERALEMAARWKCRTICVEVVKESLHTYNRFKNAVATRIQHDLGFSFNPRVKDLRPGLMPKPAKISTLDLRFEHGLVKLPLWKRYKNPSYDRLFSQIEDFSPQVKDGGLQHDDELDTLAMSVMVIKGRPSDFVEEEVHSNIEQVDVMKEIREGRTTLSNGYNWIAGLDPSLMDMSALMGREPPRNTQPNRA